MKVGRKYKKRRNCHKRILSTYLFMAVSLAGLRYAMGIKMKKYFFTALFTSIFMITLTSAMYFVMLRQESLKSRNEKEKIEEELDENISGKNKVSIDQKTVVPLKTTGAGANLFLITPKDLNKVYNCKISAEIQEHLMILQKRNNFTFENPLWALNPFGTNNNGLYLSFESEEKSYLKYTISVDKKDIPDFTRILYNNGEGRLGYRHEYQLTGLVPGEDNYITLMLFNESDQLLGQKVFKITADQLKTDEDTRLKVTKGKSTNQMSNGLYCTLGSKNILFYDNSGILRGEIPLSSYRSDRILFINGNMLYGCSHRNFAAVNPLGQVVKTYSTGAYIQHHDFVYDGYRHLYVLATKEDSKTIEDLVISLDLNSSQVKEVLDFKQIFPKTYKAKSNGVKYPDWIKINSISMADADAIIASSEKLSSIIRINSIMSKRPTVKYMITDPDNWTGSDYKDLILAKAADNQQMNFSTQLGQNSVVCTTENGLSEGQYYLYMFNNNFNRSKYYKYLVDETKGSYNLTDEFSVLQSKTDGCVQDYSNHVIVTSSEQGIFAEYDEGESIIKQFEVKNADKLYRVFKYDMKNFWFQ